jgi:hypothetical protein
MEQLLLFVGGLIVLAIIARVLGGPVRSRCHKVINSDRVRNWRIKRYTKKAEKLFPGQKRGAEKKAWVKEQTDKWCDAADDTVDEIIDSIVAAMNQKKTGLRTQAQSKANDVVSDAVDRVIGDNNENRQPQH